MPRLAPLDLNKLTPEQKKAADAIVAGPRGGLRGPFEPWLRRPAARRPRPEARRILPLQQLAAASDLARAGDLPGRPALQGAVRVLRPCPARQGSRPVGRRSSRRCAPRQTPPFTRDVERIVYDFVTEYLETNRVADAQLQARRRRLRRAGRGRSGGRVRLLHAGVDDAQRLRDAAAAGRAGAAGLAMTFLLFLAAASVIALSPGPGIFYVAARTLADGRGTAGVEPGHGRSAAWSMSRRARSASRR